MTLAEEFANRQKIIVFGGSGFIGSHLCRRLAAAGERVLSVDARDPAERVAGIEYRRGDVRDLSGFDAGGPVKRIYNLAAVHTTPGHPTHQYYEANILGALETTAFARRCDVNEIVFTSSISVYGPSEESKTELSSPAPTSAYGWSKFLAERAHRAWLDEDERHRLVICRPAVIFGHGEGGNFTRLAKLLRQGFFIYPGRKDTIKACFYVEDLIDAIESARQETDRFVLFNGCYPDRYTLEQIVEAFRAHHMPNARTIMLPRMAVTSAAAVLRPVSAIGLGIHPERVTKLVKSTDIIPQWLQSRGLTKPNRLREALAHWAASSNGMFV
jgi:nucleoside-diphosphate-sugar epimerase